MALRLRMSSLCKCTNLPEAYLHQMRAANPGLTEEDLEDLEENIANMGYHINTQ